MIFSTKQGTEQEDIVTLAQ